MKLEEFSGYSPELILQDIYADAWMYNIVALKLIEAEENKFTKKIEKTDIVTRIGPTLGLMGTLIPMGPGLAALGAGDVNTLANAIIVAFDTTVVGIG